MSLAGYMPPICDPLDGALILDGGYVNNLPVDIMRERFSADRIVAVDVEGKVKYSTCFGGPLLDSRCDTPAMFPGITLFRPLAATIDKSNNHVPHR